MRRKKLNRKQSSNSFRRGNKINKRNVRLPVTSRGGYRI